MQDLSSEAQALQAQLLSRYVASLPEKRARIYNCWQRVESSGWNADMLAKLKAEVHRLAGSAGSYGLEELGALASTFEASLKLAATSPQPRGTIGQQFTHLIQSLDAALNNK